MKKQKGASLSYENIAKILMNKRGYSYERIKLLVRINVVIETDEDS